MITASIIGLAFINICNRKKRLQQINRASAINLLPVPDAEKSHVQSVRGAQKQNLVRVPQTVRRSDPTLKNDPAHSAPGQCYLLSFNILLSVAFG